MTTPARPQLGFPDLVSAALVGTDRRTPPPVPVTAAVPSDPALGLLARAAATVVPGWTGTPPRPFDGALPEPMPADPRPVLPPDAVVRLRSLLGSYTKYLPEWLAAARAAGYRPPAAQLPVLLDYGRANTEVRDDLAALAGAPGRWLAAGNPQWTYLLREARETLDPADWAGPDPDARIAYAAGLYRRDPEAARDLVRTGWAEQRVPVKLGLLGLLGRHPDPQDLPFVESLEKDPSKQVREEALYAARALRRVRDQPPRPPFTAALAEVISAKGVGRDLHNLVTGRGGEPWPEDGARLLLDTLAAHTAAEPSAYSTEWLVEQIQTALGDNAPVSLYGDAARLVARQSLDAAEGDRPHPDLTTMLTLLAYRRDMLAELAAPAPAVSGTEQ